ncbi:MAG TPA: alcohol dehydrogenase catalytic domain-containing protein [Bryobacteraceae bacterium]|nr:alcohol dehydrogenase catalytic domain-containing protein [Bryobacteraceae bacterium]
MIPTSCRAATLPHAQGAIAVAATEVREPGPAEVVLRMEACGVCHSDLFIAGLEKVPLEPLILGHEGIGRVVAAGAQAEGWNPGDRAGITFLATTCGECEWCHSERARFCPAQANFGYTLPGALAEYVVAPAAGLIHVPVDLPAIEMAPLCCAGWTACGALREAGLRTGQSVALFGLGGLGHLALQMARHRGLRVAAVDVSPEKLEMARGAGAEATMEAETAGRALQKQGGVDAAIVLTASASAVHQAFRALKRGGTLVLVGLSRSLYELPLMDTITKGITVRGSYLGTPQDLEEVFQLAQAGILRPQVRRYALEEVPAVLERMKRGELAGRAVIGF